jgi:hypothetical protein
VSCKDRQGVPRVKLLAGEAPAGPGLKNLPTANISVLDAHGKEVYRVEGAAVLLGGNGRSGELVVRDAAAKDVFRVDAAHATVRIGTLGNEGDLQVQDAQGRTVLHANAANAALRLGANGVAGTLLLQDVTGSEALRLQGATLILGAPTGNAADMRLRDAKGLEVIHFDGANAGVRLGANGNDGDVRIHDLQDREVIHLDGGNSAVRIGAMGNSGRLTVADLDGKETITLDGRSGDIILANADCAEYFEAEGELEPGTVVVVGDDGRIRSAGEAYDTRVAGIISGAGRFKPGLLLDGGAVGCRHPVALVGKVFCKADAHHGAIRAGDLLTSSPTPGHAMKVCDRGRAFGAVIGKALKALDSGRGLIPVLVTLK